MPIKTVQVFETSDGCRFDNLASAEEHQAKLDIRSEVTAWSYSVFKDDLAEEVATGIWTSWETLLPVLLKVKEAQASATAEERGTPLAGEALRDVLNLEVQNINIPSRVANALTGNGFTRLGDFVGKTAEEVAALPKMGERSLGQLQEALRALRVGFETDVSGWESPDLPPLDPTSLEELFTMARVSVSSGDEPPALTRESLDMIASVEEAVYARLGLNVPVREKADDSDLEVSDDDSDLEVSGDDFGDASGEAPDKPISVLKPDEGDVDWKSLGLHRAFEDEDLEEEDEDEDEGEETISFDDILKDVADPHEPVLSAAEKARIERMERRSGKAVTPVKMR